MQIICKYLTTTGRSHTLPTLVIKIDMKKYSLASALLLMFFTAASPAFASAVPCPYNWNRTLTVGMTGADVLALQQFLNKDPLTAVATAGAGSTGFETTSFGGKTAKAVTTFQEKYRAEVLAPAGLSRGTGSIGPRTRAKLNELCAAAPTSLVPTATTISAAPVLSISRPEQPMQGIAPSGAGGVPFTMFVLSTGGSDAQVKSITIQRVGAGVDGAFESVYVESEDGSLASEEKRLNAAHVAVLGADFTIPANSTVPFTVFGNMDDTADYEGQMPSLRVLAIDASTPVEGALPLDGTAQTINATLEIGSASATLSSYDPQGDRDLYINETGVRFSGIRITADSREDLELSTIEWEQAGSAGVGDITNVVTVIDGVSYPTRISGRVYATAFSPAIVVKKGGTIDVHVQGDILPSAANRTIKFDVRESGAIELTGLQYGFGVGVTAGGNTAPDGNSIFTTSDGTGDGEEMIPFFSGSTIQVSSGGFVSVSRN